MVQGNDESREAVRAWPRVPSLQVVRRGPTELGLKEVITQGTGTGCVWEEPSSNGDSKCKGVSESYEQATGAAAEHSGGQWQEVREGGEVGFWLSRDSGWTMSCRLFATAQILL